MATLILAIRRPILHIGGTQQAYTQSSVPLRLCKTGARAHRTGCTRRDDFPSACAKGSSTKRRQ